MEAVMGTVQTIFIAIIPSILSGVILLYIRKKDAKEEKREKTRAKNNVLLLKGVTASLALGEATATAIKAGKCNGEMDAAQKYAVGVKHEIKNFMYTQGSEHII